MTKKYWIELIIIVFFVLSVGILVGATLYSGDIKHLKNQVVESYDKGYSDGESDALFDLMEDYYDVLIENAVLKERLKNQPSNEEYIQQIIDDFELTIELLQHYYENNITTHSFSDWIQINYPALYERILNYY